jgi:hypothetical protein
VTLSFKIFFLLCLTSFSIHQTFTQTPSPDVGWDSLRQELYFPAIAGRTDTKGPYVVTMGIRSDGRVEFLHFLISDDYPKEYLDSLLLQHIRSVLESAVWIPARENNNPVKSQLDITILFRGAKAYLMYDHEDRLFKAGTPIDRIRNTTLMK